MRLGYNSQSTIGWPGFSTRGVAVIHRPIAPDYAPEDVLDWIKRYRKWGIPVLVDEDDDIGRIPSTNTWRASRQQIKFHDWAIGEADGLIVTTQRLEEVYGPLASRVWRVPNFLPARIAPSILNGNPPPSQVRVGWAGVVDTHLHDLQWFAPVVRQAMQDAIFVSVGDKRVPGVLGLNPGEYKVAPWVQDELSFYKLMGQCDIGIVPLKPILFNEAKSNLKVREFLALGKPVVVTDLPDQRELLEGTGAGILVKGPREFADAVQTLVHDVALRERMTQAAIELGRGITLERNADRWLAPLDAIGKDGGG